MMDDLDDLLDDPKPTAAPRALRFKPKINPALKKPTPPVAPQSTVQKIAKDEAPVTLPTGSEAVKPVQPVNVFGVEEAGSLGSALGSLRDYASGEPCKITGGQASSDGVVVSEAVIKEDINSGIGQLESGKSETSGVLHPGRETSAKEVDMMELDLDPFSASVPEPATGNAGAGRKFLPRINKARLGKATSEISAPASSNPDLDKPNNLVCAVLDVGNKIGSADDNGNSDQVNSSGAGTTHAVSLGALIDDQHSMLGKSLGENADIFSGLESIDDLVPQAKSGGEIPMTTSNEKFQGEKPGFPSTDSDNSAALRVSHVSALESVTCLEVDREELRSEDRENFQKLDLDESPVPTLPQDDVLDYSSLSLDDFIAPNDTAADFLRNEEKSNPPGISHLGDENLHTEGACAVPQKEISDNTKKKGSSRSRLSSKSKISSLGSNTNEGGKSSRQLRKRAVAPRLVNEPEDDGNESADLSAEPPSIPSGEEDDEDDEEYRVEKDDTAQLSGGSSPQKKRASKKPKKDATGKEKPVRKCKTANDPQEKSTKEPRKKFSHSTSRRKRLGNKDVLKMPEEEIDYRSLRICDFILLLEHKDKLAAKAAKASKTPENDERTEDSVDEESQYEDGSSTSASDKGYTIKTGPEPQSTPVFFNSHSFMKKTPVVRWTAQDTELFYKGIRQFGTDLGMIQHLFPGRTRQQIKLKYKKEERQNPFKLSDALATRSKDHSYFEKVIELLQKASAAEEANRDDSVALTGDEEAGLNPETYEVVAKPDPEKHASTKQPEQGVADGPEADFTKQNDEQDDDEMDIWSTYKSEF